MAAALENRLGSYEKRKEQIRRYELFLEQHNSTEDVNRKPTPKTDSKKSKFKIRFPDGCVFLAACSSGVTEDVAELLRNTNADINTTNVDGLTGLHQACINEDIKMVKFLVEHGIDINMRDNEGWTALHAAAQSGFIDIAKFLIDKGAKLDLINCDCELPLDLSQKDSMSQLLQNAMKQQGIDGDAARNAEERAMMDDVRRWGESGSYDGATDERTGASPLHVAAVKGYLDIMKSLIQLGLSVDALDNEGWTPLHGAAHWGQEEACKLLAEYSCNLNTMNLQGNTPLEVADPSVVPLLEELLEKHKTHLENPNIPKAAIKPRKTSITRMSSGQMKDMQKKNEGSEKPPPKGDLANLEDEDSFVDANKSLKKKLDDGDRVVTTFESKVSEDVETPALLGKSEMKSDEVLSEDHIQFLLEERKKKLGQQRVSDSNVDVIMRRDTPRGKINSEATGLRMIASDLMRRSGDPSLWRYAFRRSSNSENDLDVRLMQVSDAKRMKTGSGETDEDKEQKKIEAQSPGSLSVVDSVEGTPRQTSLLRPETAAALASIASSHQRLSDVTKRDDANELERKLKAKRARESRRSTQGVTKEDIQRAEDTLKAAYQDSTKTIVPASTERSALPGTEGGSGDVNTDSGRHSPPSLPDRPVDAAGAIDPSTATIIEKWQKKENEGIGRGDSRSSVFRTSAPDALPLHQKKEFSNDTLTLYRKMSSQEDNPQKGTMDSSSDSLRDQEPVHESSSKMSASRARRKRESRRPTGKISLDGTEAPVSDLEDEDSESSSLPVSSALTSRPFPVSSALTSRPPPASTTDVLETFSPVLPKSVPSTSTLPSPSLPGSFNRTTATRSYQDPVAVTPCKTSSVPRQERWSVLSSSWQQQQLPQSGRSSAILTSYDSPLSCQNFRGGSSSLAGMQGVDYQKLWEQEKLENEALKKRVVQMERDLHGAQMQLLATPTKSFERSDAREKRATERKLAELEEEKKSLEKKMAGMEEELKKLEPMKNDNAKLRSENAALIRVISKLSK